jgi:NAD(P)-dependent dehydrogenase (short-subunit alcohol dehydrogenase family)
MVRPVPPGLAAAYAAAQAGMTALAGSLAAEWADKGVRVAAIDAADIAQATSRLLDLCEPK